MEGVVRFISKFELFLVGIFRQEIVQSLRIKWEYNKLGFKHTEASRGVGQPAFDPAVLLKLYLHGYPRGVRSSRKLEYETRFKLEVMWLCQGAQPSYKTIADFRKHNAKALKAAPREFLVLCRELELFGAERVAVDGSFVKADASRSNMHTAAHLKRTLKKLDEKITEYHQQLDEADAQDGASGEVVGSEDAELAAKLARLQERQTELKQLQEQLQESGAKQVSMVDPDARLLTKRGQTVGGYNAQLAVVITPSWRWMTSTS